MRDRLRKANLTARLRASEATNGPAAEPWSLTAPPPPAPRLPFPSSLPVPDPELREDADVNSPSFPQFPASESGTGRETGTGSEKAATSGSGYVEDSRALQLHDTYLVLETPEGMLVIDQHALHERILFEQFKSRVRSGTLETQHLLIPEPVELSADQAARTLEHRDALAELGLGVEDFGGSTVLLTSYPAMLGHRSPRAVLKAVVDHLVGKDRPPTREQLLNDLLSLMACHAAVRAGDRLTTEQIAALVAQRHLANDTHHCPHGRPTTLLFSRHDLDRQFRRI